jgi:hypothetical protein
MVDVPTKLDALRHEALEQESFLEKPESAAAEADRTLRADSKKPKGGGGGDEGGGGGSTGGSEGSPPGEGSGGGEPRPGGTGQSSGTPSAGAGILDALGALGAANLVVTVISGKDPLGNFSDLVMGGLRLDPEARVRFGEGLQITPEDRRAAEAQSIKRQVDASVKQYAKAHGVSQSEARRRMQQAAHQGPSYPEIGPGR